MLTSTRLFGDGKHGQAERIQTFRCQSCHGTFSARRDTPLYRLKTPSQQVAMVLTVLAEGLDPSAAERVFGYRQTTITSLSVPRWRARSDLARTLLPPSLAPASPTGRTTHEATQR
jgi:transposase-like protein